MPDAVVTDDRALRLAELWSRLSARHVTLGSACGCGVGGVSVTLEDFERDIADYLWHESERLGARAAHAFLAEAGPIEAQPQPVRALLDRLCEGLAPPDAADWLLPRLSRTLESFASLHGPTGGMG